MATFMAAFPNLAVSTAHDTTAARVHHLCLALRLINQRLSGGNAATDENIIVVLLLGLYETFTGAHDRRLVHVEGLQRIVEMRGGIRAFAKSNPIWGRKIFR